MLSRGAKPVKERARRGRGCGGSDSGRRERLSFAAGLASRLDVFWRPGVDHLYPATLEGVDVPRRHRDIQRAGYRRDLAIGVADGISRGATGGGYRGVGTGGVPVERKDAPGEIFVQHCFHFCSQPVAALTRRQYLDSVAQLGFADGRDVEVWSLLLSEPLDHIMVGSGPHQLRDYVGV